MSKLGFVALLGCGPTVGTPGATETGTADGTTSAPPITTTADATGVPVTSANPVTSAGPGTTDPVGTTSEDTDDPVGTSTGEPPVAGPPDKLMILYTPHGFYRNQTFDESFNLGPMLAPLESWKDEMLIVDGINNIGHLENGDVVGPSHNYTYSALLTGGLVGSGTGGGGPIEFHFAGGPSLDILLGEALGAAAPLRSLHLGVRVTPGWPTTVSYLGADEPNPAINSPQLAFDTLFTGVVDPLVDEVAAALPDDGGSTPSEELTAHFAIAHAALALEMTPVVLLSIDDAYPQIFWQEFGHTSDLHEMMVTPSEEPNVVTVQTLWAEQLAAFLQRMNESGALDETIVLWISDLGDNPPAHTRSAVLAVIIDTTGTFVTGDVAVVKANEADFAVTVAQSLGVDLDPFGHKLLAATPIDSLLAD